MLPRTLADIMAMGRDALHAIVRHYLPVFGLDSWEITARWVEPEDAGGGQVVAGVCDPIPEYQRAFIGIAWPPVGDVEETIVHELAHCFTAALALQAGAAPGTWARAEWERIAEQTARGMVSLRRRGERSPQVLARAFRSRFAALRRESMDPVKLAELAMKAGEMAAREDVPEDVRQLLAEFVAALAGGGGEAGPAPEPAATEDPNAPPAATEDQGQMPAYMRKVLAEFSAFKATVASELGALRSAPPRAAPVAPAVNPELTEMRRTSVETFLSTKPNLLSAETERQLVDKGDIKLARWMVAEVERKAVERAGARSPGGTDAQLPALTAVHRQAARRHNLTDEQYAKSLQRQQDKKAFLGRGGK